jgi:hypothetical protein
LTTDDQKNVLGGLMLERKGLREQQTTIRAKLSEIGRFLEPLGQALASYGGIPRPGDSVRYQPNGIHVLASHRAGGGWISGHLPLEADLKGLLDELSSVEHRLAEIDQQLKPYEG